MSHKKRVIVTLQKPNDEIIIVKPKKVFNLELRQSMYLRDAEFLFKLFFHGEIDIKKYSIAMESLYSLYINGSLKQGDLRVILGRM